MVYQSGRKGAIFLNPKPKANQMTLFLSCSQPSGDRSPPSYEESISSLQLPKKLPPLNVENSTQGTSTTLKGGH